MNVLFKALLCINAFIVCCSSSPAQNQKKGGEMKEIFSPVVAGSFYPGSASEIREMLDKFDRQVKKSTDKKGEVFGLISPHAGYIYSGRTAAYGFKLAEGRKYDLVVVMAPSHRMRGSKAVILNYDAYKTCL
ncbi:MAG: AmmeMemoRadiSam system protein B, partial [Deltaproteobacteria bacterium]|nr:AmmeMemoRadiSam system protein B [Deltaproteobacteria bacterium]